MTFFINKTDLALFIFKGVVKSEVDIKIQFFTQFFTQLRQTQFTKPFIW